MSDSLRPAWNRGSGFQPPPAQSFEEPQRSRSSSLGGTGRSLADLANSRPSSKRSSTTTSPPQKVIRYTREKLLSLRGQPNEAPPEELKNLELFVSDVPQDPVCWDADLDAEAIWATKRTKEETVRRSSSRRESQSGRWQRGVALPTARKNSNTENPNDLWDDPETEFNFEAMAEASKKLEDELRPPRSRSSSMGSDASEPTKKAIDPNRPLAQSGTTIRSGSGDNVNVFEDFDEPSPAEEPTIKAVDEDPSASSRLMAMIGVTKEPEPEKKSEPEPAWSEPTSVPLNPWGQDPVMAPPPAPVVTPPVAPADLQAQLEKQRVEEEEQKRRMQQQQQQQQQQAGVQNQVETVLLERISTILENSWGRSNLGSILTTLHAEDSRVIPLLSNVDALRALLLKHPRRIAIRQDPALRAEMAALLITNSQWQAEQQNHQVQAQQVEMMQRQQEQQRRLAEEQRARAAAATPQIVPDAPWYYSDPSKNIQGPFRDQEMRQWLEAGYFKGDLPISQNPNGPFRPLSSVFSDTSNAFVAPKGNDEAQARAEQARAEKERAEKEAAELRERQQKEAEAAAARATSEAAQQQQQQQQTNGGNESSAQLKMMLGLGGGGAVAGSSEPTPVEPVAEKKPAKESAPRPAVKPSTPEPPAAPAKPSAPAWGGAAGKQTSTRKSMSEIQLEEAKAQAAARSSSNRASSSGWANVAASRGGSTGWQGGAAKKSSGAVLSNRGPGPARAMSMQPSSGSASAHAVKQPQRSASLSGDNAAEAFGAKMSPSFEKWCKEQMQKINKTDDLTLVSFCMTLTDPEEIRQYLTTYLGSTPQVSSFATEFINRKGGTKGKQDEWESTVTTKKGRKKKAGAR